MWAEVEVLHQCYWSLRDKLKWNFFEMKKDVPLFEKRKWEYNNSSMATFDEKVVSSFFKIIRGFIALSN